MSTEKTEEPSIVDGGTPTDAEALYASQLEGLGDNPTEEPAAPTPKADDAAIAAAESAKVEAETAAAVALEATAAAEAAKLPAAAPAPAPAPAASAKPEPPKDFDAAFADLQRRYDDGDIDGSAFQAEQRQLGKDEGKYTAQVTIWEERQNGAVMAANQDFQTTALAWEKGNAEFMANPLRALQMQQAMELIDKRSGYTLSPAELFDQAGKAAFEAFGYTPAKPAAEAVIDAAAALKKATDARKPVAIPATLATADAAAPIEAGRNPTFDTLDGLGISDLEDALARMSPIQQEAYLKNAPGASSTLRGDNKD